MRLRVLSAAVGIGAMALASWALAQTFDPSEPVTVVVGDPQGPSPRDRVDAGRSGRSAVPLPKAPKELWRRELAGGVELSPVVDAEGGVIIPLSSPDVVRLDAAGQQSWRVRLGSAPAAVAPSLASDGSALVLAADGVLWSLARDGSVAFRVELGLSVAESSAPEEHWSAAPLARSDGSVVVAGTGGLVVVRPPGRVVARAKLAGRPVGGLLPWRGGVVATTAMGQVHAWRPPGQPRKLGELGGPVPGGAALVSERTAVAVVGHERLVAFDLLRGTTTLMLSAAQATSPLESTVAMASDGTLLATSVVGELFGVDARGAPVMRQALEKVSTLFSGDAGVPSLFRPAQIQPSPPLVTDPEGRVAFARSSGRVGVVDKAGNLSVASARHCARPIAILPAGSGRFVVVCRSGSVAMFGDG